MHRLTVKKFHFLLLFDGFNNWNPFLKKISLTKQSSKCILTPMLYYWEKKNMDLSPHSLEILTFTIWNFLDFVSIIIKKRKLLFSFIFFYFPFFNWNDILQRSIYEKHIYIYICGSFLRKLGMEQKNMVYNF